MDLDKYRIYERVSFTDRIFHNEAEAVRQRCQENMRQKIAQHITSLAEFDSFGGMDTLSIEGYYFSQRDFEQFMTEMEHQYKEKFRGPQFAHEKQ